MFKALLTSTNADFLDTMKVEKRLWTQGKKAKTYCYKDVLDAAETSYNNIDAEKLWDAPEATSRTEKKDEATDAHLLVLTAKLEQLMSKSSNGDHSSSKQDSS